MVKGGFGLELRLGLAARTTKDLGLPCGSYSYRSASPVDDRAERAWRGQQRAWEPPEDPEADENAPGFEVLAPDPNLTRRLLFGWSRAAARIPPRQKVQERILALRLAYSSAEMAPESSNVLAWLSSCAGVLPATERM